MSQIISESKTLFWCDRLPTKIMNRKLTKKNLNAPSAQKGFRTKRGEDPKIRQRPGWELHRKQTPK